MPRQLILDYILARCTRNNPNFFDDVKFNTSVESVKFNEDLGKFIIHTVHHCENDGSVTESSIFDKCIWAAGTNGSPIIPQSISDTLATGGFKGRVMHSSESGTDFNDFVKGKNILIIGDSYSAEDLTLEAIKLGVESVNICSRTGEGMAYYTGSWPRDAVDVHYAYSPSGVTSDGFGVILSNGTSEITLEDIQTIIYCTGYSCNMDMLDPSLQPNMEPPFFSDYEIPKDWKMPKNPLSKEFGDIPLGKILYPPFVREDIYRGQLISNPNLHFLMERTETPLIDLDVAAWLALAQIIGDLPLPSISEMKQCNLDTLLHALEDPMLRGDNEENYKNRWWQVNDDHWSFDVHDKRTKQMSKSYLELEHRILARDMVDANYPLQIGTFSKLNEKGKALVEFNNICSYARYNLDDESPNASWRTFRDCNPSKCYSIVTGTRAVPLKCKWLDLDGHSIEDIVDTSSSNKQGLTGMMKNKLRIR